MPMQTTGKAKNRKIEKAERRKSGMAAKRKSENRKSEKAETPFPAIRFAPGPLSAFSLSALPPFLLVVALFCTRAAGAPLELLPTALVDGRGIFLHQLVKTEDSSGKAESGKAESGGAQSGAGQRGKAESDKSGKWETGFSDFSLSALPLCPPPLFGQVVLLTRAQIQTLGRQAAPDFATNGWAGAAQIRVGRRARSLAETELREWLTATLQREFVKERGELELRLGRPWTPVSVPDETLTLRVLDVPATGVSANFIVRFEMVCGAERFGPWSLLVQGRLMKEVLVARAALPRGQLLAEAEVAPERREVTALREPLDVAALADASLEINESISAGQPLLARSVRRRPVVLRGQLIEALMQDGTLSIRLKVEALSDGLPGQMIRVRNPKTKREFYAKIKNDQTVLLSL